MTLDGEERVENIIRNLEKKTLKEEEPTVKPIS